MYNFCNMSNELSTIFLSLIFRISVPLSNKTIFRSKSTLDSPKSAFKRKPSLVVPVYKFQTDFDGGEANMQAWQIS